jgi:hypothetical protein
MPPTSLSRGPTDGSSEEQWHLSLQYHDECRSGVSLANDGLDHSKIQLASDLEVKHGPAGGLRVSVRAPDSL